jgi:hypothetical protein
MSEITFASRDSQASVRGHERAYGAALAARLTAAVLDLDGRDSTARNRRILPDSFFQQAALAQHQATRENRGFSLAEVFSCWAPMAAMFGDDQLQIGNQHAGVTEVVTNTAIVAGSGPIALLARIHASAEDGLFVDAAHTNWLANIIDTGVQTNILRDHRGGWNNAAQLLRKTTGPVLITTQSSASAKLAAAAGIYSDQQTEEQQWAAEEQFESMPFTQQWDRSIDELQAARSGDRDWWLTLAPENFHVPAYLNGLTAFTAIATTATNTPSVDLAFPPPSAVR